MIGSGSCTLCISKNYTVYSFGASLYGSHGHKDVNQIINPKQINNLTEIKMIDCGTSHSICLNYDGEVFSFGRNNNGQLGIGKDNYELRLTSFPQKINLPPCKHVSCGSDYSICLTEDNVLYSFGNNNYGQLGLRNNDNYSSPQLIPNLNNIEFIECGGSHNICKTYNNEFYSWGKNGYGQLGQSNYKDCNKPIQCLTWPDNIISIKCGYDNSLLLTLEGQIYSFGKQVSNTTTGFTKRSIPFLIKDIPAIKQIECGAIHSICIDYDSNLWVFGYNSFGQLGLGDNRNRIEPVLHPTLSNILDISSRGFHTFVKIYGDKIYAFGYNISSQLGIKTSAKYQLLPIQVLEGNEDIWCSTIGKSRAKSARK